MIKPNALKKHDTIGLICPGDRPMNKSSIYRIKNIIENLGFNVILGNNVFKYNGHTAGTDSERVEDIHNCYADKSIKAIFCISGGYGSLKLLPYLNFELIKENPKIIIGSHENTALLLAINKMTSQIVFNAKNLVEIKEIKEFEDIFNSLSNANQTTKIALGEKISSCANFSYNTNTYTNTITGNCYGINLSSLVSLVGTKYCPNFDNTILLLDDYSEKSDTLERHFSQLYHASFLKKVKTIVFGIFDKCYNNQIPNQFSIEDLFDDYLNDLKLPAYFNVLFNKIIPLGAKCSLDNQNLEINFAEKYFND